MVNSFPKKSQVQNCFFKGLYYDYCMPHWNRIFEKQFSMCSLGTTANSLLKIYGRQIQSIIRATFTAVLTYGPNNDRTYCRILHTALMTALVMVVMAVFPPLRLVP